MRERASALDLIWKLSDVEIALILEQDPSFELPRLCNDSLGRMQRARAMVGAVMCRASGVGVNDRARSLDLIRSAMERSEGKRRSWKPSAAA